MKKALIICSLVVLAGCETAQVGVQTAVAKKQQFNDGKAQLSLVLPCDITVGAFFRSLNPSQQRAVEALCGGESMPKKPKLSPE